MTVSLYILCIRRKCKAKNQLHHMYYETFPDHDICMPKYLYCILRWHLFSATTTIQAETQHSLNLLWVNVLRYTHLTWHCIHCGVTESRGAEDKRQNTTKLLIINRIMLEIIRIPFIKSWGNKQSKIICHFEVDFARMKFNFTEVKLYFAIEKFNCAHVKSKFAKIKLNFANVILIQLCTSEIKFPNVNFNFTQVKLSFAQIKLNFSRMKLIFTSNA